MKRSLYYRGKDIRAVENPYDASFDLAGKIRILTLFMLGELFLLLLVLVFYLRQIALSIHINLLELEPGFLNYLGAFLSIPLAVLVIITIIRIISSIKFLVKSRRNHWLIHGLGGSFKKLSEEIPEYDSFHKDPPHMILIELIKSTSEHFRKLTRTFCFIIAFYTFWIVTMIIWFSIEYIRWGRMNELPFILHHPDQSGLISVDWIVPSGLEASVNILPVVLILLLYFQFRFIKRRYDSIDYAFNQSPVQIPRGKDPIDRYVKFLLKQKGYESMKEEGKWKKDDYFNAIIRLKRGWVFIKYLEKIPKLRDLEDFRKLIDHKKKGKKLDRAVIIFKGDEAHPLNQEVYDSVIERPMVYWNDICNIQLVEEGADGTYDFIPLISF